MFQTGQKLLRKLKHENEMFDSKTGKFMGESQGNQPNRIEKNTTITGNIDSENDFRIDGKLEGDIKTSGKVVIGQNGRINGKIECVSADVEGYFTGDITVSETLSLKETATIEGTVKAGKLQIVPGAKFNAKCQMSSRSAPLSADKSMPTKTIVVEENKQNIA